MSQTASSARVWAIVGVVGGALALIGFFVPWFFASGQSFSVNGVQIFQVVADVGDTPGILLLVLPSLIVLLAALDVLMAGFFDLSGRSALWTARLQLWAASLGLVFLLLAVGAFELLFHALANFDTLNPDAALIPGVGVWLMFVGFVVALVGNLRSRSARRAPQAVL
jgi:hypothetical protein